MQLGSRMHPPGLSSKLAFEKASAQCGAPVHSLSWALMCPLPWKGHHREMREDRLVGELMSCTWSPLGCCGFICILKLEQLIPHYTRH